MDYEKLHKDTIAKLQEMVNSGKITVETARGICADFVPESEDERIRKDLINYLKSVLSNKKYGDKFIEDWIAWLEKQGEQKPAWSEEDEKLLDNTIRFIENCVAATSPSLRTYNPTLTGKEIPFLKSLKDRYTWKPSDEQMHYLSWIANVKLGDSVVEQEVSKHLNELLEDLKKLREK